MTQIINMMQQQQQAASEQTTSMLAQQAAMTETLRVQQNQMAEAVQHLAARQPVASSEGQGSKQADTVRLAKQPPPFTGKAGEWPTWSFKMRRYLTAVDPALRKELDEAEMEQDDPAWVDMAPETSQRAAKLAYIIMMFCEEAALTKVQNISEPDNGYMIWRHFLAEWEPKVRGRFRAMLQGILNHNFVEATKANQVEAWEKKLKMYEQQSGCTVPDDIKAALAAGFDKDDKLGPHINLNANRLETYDMIREEVVAFNQATRGWNVQGLPTDDMDVSALQQPRPWRRGDDKGGKDGEKGKKGDGRGDDGKGGKRNVKPDKNDADKDKEKKCFFCKKKGHLRKDCPEFKIWLDTKKGEGHKSGDNSALTLGSTASCSETWIFAFDLERLREEADRTPQEDSTELNILGLVLVDSGAAVDACPPTHAEENPIRETASLPLRTATNEAATQYDAREGDYDTELGEVHKDCRSECNAANMVGGTMG